MYGIPAKRFEHDIYKKNPRIKKIDYVAGFLVAALFWAVFFEPNWYAVPLAVFCLAMAGIIYNFERRYFIYGMLSVVFLPFLFWGILMVGWAGRNEINS